MAKATIISAVITGVLLGGAQLAGYFINKKEEQPTTVWNNFNSGFQGVINNFSDTKSKVSTDEVETVAATPVSSSLSKRLKPSDFPSGTLGELARGTSLLDGATWQLDAAPGDRSLNISFSIWGRKTENSKGSMTARLVDNRNRIICTVTAVSSNSDTFSNKCFVKGYVVPADSSIILRSEAKSENASISDIQLEYVGAVAR
ncbi:hypothetical protein [Neisseria sp.]|uniref:hypothetical protein n=1 Tax=Neisseria sp. TaxID=192066 RepID=UPI0026DB79B2|nr:hypothetical protein [Neisseria sp.]MDO4226308.1 hypothetical protein [Neisseria sp.]